MPKNPHKASSLSKKHAQHNSSPLESLLYLSLTFLYGIGVYNDHLIYIEGRFAKLGLDIHTSFGGRAKYLTHLNLVIQFIYFSLSLINIVLEFISEARSFSHAYQTLHSIYVLLDKFVNFLFVSVVWPIGVLVSIVFWGLFFINRDLIYPVILETVIPGYQNHLLHTLPIFGVIFDSLLKKHRYNSSFILGVLPTILFSLSYIVWVLIIAHFGGAWVYPILKVLSFYNRIAFFAATAALAAFLYKLGQVINTSFWSSKKDIKKAI